MVASVMSSLGAKLEEKEKELKKKDDELAILKDVESNMTISREIHERCLEDADKRAIEFEKLNKEILAENGEMKVKLERCEGERQELVARLETGARHYRKLAAEKSAVERSSEQREELLKSRVAELERQLDGLHIEPTAAVRQTLDKEEEDEKYLIDIMKTVHDCIQENDESIFENLHRSFEVTFSWRKGNCWDRLATTHGRGAHGVESMWKRIREAITGGEIRVFYREPEFYRAFWKSLEMERLQKHESKVNDIILVAQGEMALEEFLKQVKETWNTYELDLIDYQNKCRIIRGWDVLFDKLKENINQVAAMKLSPYYKVFEEEALTWEDKLNRINALFDVWIDVQRRWVYLEGIFS